MDTKAMGCCIVLEGADNSGKTTLSLAIADRVMQEGGDFMYLHGRPWVGTVLREHTRMAGHAAIAGRDTVVVMDHFWIAEYLYGFEYRGKPAYDVKPMDATMQQLRALIVLCVPTNLVAQTERHLERRAKGKEEFAQASGIIRRYADLWHGNRSHKGDGYLDAAIRGETFCQRNDVVRYDMDLTEDVNQRATKLLTKARQRRWVSNMELPH